MTDLDLVICNGTVVTAADTIQCDVGIKDSRVSLLGHDLRGKRTLDATGKLVLPGGIDAHVHIAERPFLGVSCADDFETGSRAAACGGTTTMIPFAEQIAGRSLREAIEEYHARADGRSVIDYAFHLILSDINEQVLGQELPALVEDGYTSFKVYMTYDGLALNDREILNTLEAARGAGALVMVHAENDHCIHWLSDKLQREGKTEIANYPDMAPAAIEREATHRAITLSEVADVPILIVHVSASEAAEQIRWARDRGLTIYGETCPQYLFLSAEQIRQPGWEGAKYLCAPPPRERSNQALLWRGLANGVFQVFSSDHCPYVFEGSTGKKAHGPEPHFRHVTPGVPGIELRQVLLYSEGVRKGRIDLNTFVALSSTNAAKIYGLYPRKGTIAAGSDADITIWDPNLERTVTSERLHEAVDYTPYEGLTLTGWPVTTLSRGEVIYDDGEVHASAGRGDFLRCDRSVFAVPQSMKASS